MVIETLAFSPAEEEDELLEGFDDGEGGAPAVDGTAGRVPLTEPENRALVTAVHEVVAEFDSPDFPLHVAGGPVVEVFFNAAMQEKRPYELICLDVMMPQMNGHEALSAIRAAEKDLCIVGHDGVKVIMTTSMNESAHIMGAFREGCEAYLVKPVDKVKLYKEIEKLGFVLSKVE